MEVYRYFNFLTTLTIISTCARLGTTENRDAALTLSRKVTKELFDTLKHNHRGRANYYKGEDPSEMAKLNYHVGTYPKV